MRWRALAGLLVATQAAPLHAATYNFYFNNTEQGNNSTATPSLTVQDGKMVPTTSASPTPDASASPAPAAPQAAPAPQASQEVGFYSQPRRKKHHFRFIGGAAYTDISYKKPGDVFNSNPRDPRPFWEQTTLVSSRRANFSVSGSWFFSEHTGLSVVLGDVIGTEFEFAPLGVSEFFQPAIMAGLGTGGAVSTSVFPYVGARAQLNLGKNFGISFAVRKDIPTDEDLKVASFEAGLVFRL